MPGDALASPHQHGGNDRKPPTSAPLKPPRADRPPDGPDWVHEIKHDGYRLMARRDPIGIRLLSRNGNDWSPRYPLIVEAVNRLIPRPIDQNRWAHWRNPM